MSSSHVLKVIAFTLIGVVVIVVLTLINGPTMKWIPPDTHFKSLYPAVDNGRSNKHATSSKSQSQLDTNSHFKNMKTNEQLNDANTQKTKVLALEKKRNEFLAKRKDAISKVTLKQSTTDEHSEISKPSDKSNRSKGDGMVRVNSASAKKNDVKKPFINPKRLSLKQKEQNSYQDRKSEMSIDRLVEILTNRIQNATVKKVKLETTCDSKEKLANSCDKTKNCLRMELPSDVKSRVIQLVTPKKLQLTLDIHKTLREMAKNVQGHHDVILATAASSNHFYESQAMIKNVHEKLFPVLKNFTFIFYNLGLSAEERDAMVKNCRCQVLDFPFEKFPDFMRNLHCYSWKPVLIKAHLQNANVLIWADASVRFHDNPGDLRTVIQQTRQRGIQIGGSSNRSPFRTYRKMYHYFEDEPCVYLNMGQAKATVGFYARDPFVNRVILEPWVACAVHEDCICKRDSYEPQTLGCVESKKVLAEWLSRKGSITYGLCHRYDQSAISIILHKLYQDVYRWVMINVLQFVDFKRGHTLAYFPD